MSKIALSPNQSGTGVYTLASPAGNTDRTLMMPDATTTLIGNDTADTLTNKSIVATQLTGTIAAARLPAGSVLQVSQAILTGTQAISGVSVFTDITNLSVTITPTSSTSKFLLNLSVHIRGDSNSYLRFVRNSTAVGIGDASGNKTRVTSGNAYVGFAGNGNSWLPFSAQFLDSPATLSSITYKVQIYNNNGAGTGVAYVNYSNLETDDAASGRAISTLTVMEIAA